ncbi:MAG: hypothetical protein CMJ78_03980 [Planctomycetaceae bacterium]|nr:hypothetical protein [Planctomycetaceae bacterium]
MRADPPKTRGPRWVRDEFNGWEISITGELTDKEPDLFREIMEVPRRSRGIIYFDSGGGSAYVGLALATLIRLRGLDAIGVVTGECSSAAILPFAACRQRFVTPQCTLLFHPMRWSSEEDVRLEEAAEWARHFKNLEQGLDGLIAKLLDYPLEKINEWVRPGRFVSGPELVEAGLAKSVNLFDGDIWTQIARQSS